MKKFLKLLLVPVLFASCGLGDESKIIKLNDTIVEANTEVAKSAEHFGNLLEAAIKTQNYATLKPERVKLGQLVDAKIGVISKMQDVGGSEEFRKTELEYLNLQKKCIDEGFSRLEQITDKTSMTEVEKIMNEVQEMASKEDSYVNRLNVLQTVFAKKNHLTLESDKKEE